MATADDDARAGLGALRSGDAAAARDFLVRAVEAGRADAQVLFGLAQACRRLADARGAGLALDRLLRAEPQNLTALIQRGDLYADAGDTRAAASFYQAALRVAPPRPQLAAAMVQELDRLDAACARLASDYARGGHRCDPR